MWLGRISRPIPKLDSILCHRPLSQKMRDREREGTHEARCRCSSTATTCTESCPAPTHIPQALPAAVSRPSSLLTSCTNCGTTRKRKDSRHKLCLARGRVRVSRGTVYLHVELLYRATTISRGALRLSRKRAWRCYFPCPLMSSSIYLS